MSCYRCGRPFDPDEFARDASKASGFKSICKTCDSASSARYYAANRDAVIARVVAHRQAERSS